MRIAFCIQIRFFEHLTNGVKTLKEQGKIINLSSLHAGTLDRVNGTAIVLLC